MLSQFIAIVLSSTVIAAVVSAILTFIQNNKNSNLQYITSERKEWREKLRNISEEVREAEGENIIGVLDKLKVRINAYGKYNKDFFKDSHIWHLINITEIIAKNYPEKLDDCKDLLVFAISLNLKFDWEKSKYEVKGDINDLLEKLGLLVFAIIFEGLLYTNIGFEYFTTIFITVILIYIFVIMHIKMSNLIVLFQNGKNEEFTKANKVINIYNYIIIMYLICISCFMYMNNKPLDINLGTVSTTITKIVNYALIIILPYMAWHHIWKEKFLKKVKTIIEYNSNILKILESTKKIIEFIDIKRIEELYRMYDDELITEEQFQAKIKDILNKK